jgi:hypothetical protein
MKKIFFLILILALLTACGTTPNTFTYHEAPECNVVSKVKDKECKGNGINKCTVELEDGAVVDTITEPEVGEEVCYYVDPR